MKRPPLIVLPVLVLLALAAGGALWLIGEPRAQTATAAPEPLPNPEFGGPFSLTDQDGMRRTDKDFRGKFMLIFFGYTYCPDVCPTTLAVEAEALEMLGPRASRIVPIFVTVDPKRDTPAKLKSYLASFNAKPPSRRPDFIGLTGTEKEIAKTAEAYNVYYRAHLDGFMAQDAGYSIEHTSDIYLMSPEGKFVAYYSQGILPDELATDLMRKTRPAAD